jgi:pimeloyl-ACP methyl ester carboxylesterase
MGGYAITLAADEMPDKVARLVYLAAAVPADGETIGLIGEHWPATVGMPFDQFMEVVELPNLGPCRRFTDQEAANKIFYADCTSEDQQWAWDHLTAQQLSISEDRFHLPRFRTAPIPKDYIVTTQDEALPPEFMSGLMQRLGLTTAFCIVASHSPFLSRPEETAILLNACALGLLG